jgi:hypothetical protein
MLPSLNNVPLNLTRPNLINTMYLDITEYLRWIVRRGQ